MKTPILQTERLLLRPLTVSDAEEIYRGWTSDPAVAKFMRWERHKDVADTREWLISEEALTDSDEVYNWGFVRKETGELIGSGGLIWVEEKGMFELGYNIMQKYWGRGFATEAAARIIAFGREVLSQTRFYCCHAKENPASGKVMRKVGFRYQNDGIYHSWDRTRSFESEEYLLEIE